LTELENKTWLVTGGSGFLGNQLTKDILDKHNPKEIRILSRSEARQAEMKRSFKDDRLRFIIGDVSDDRSVNKALRGVDVCIHAAAMKRIDTCEENPIESVKVNVKGTINIIESALHHNIECLLFTSTDKAPKAETTYGAGKYLAERLMRNAYQEKGDRQTQFKTTRYGNVWNSTGSVAKIWDKQYEDKKPLTVTSKEMTRFFMSVGDASKLVLDTIESGEENTEHSLPMKSVNVYDFCKHLYPNQEIEVTGLRHAEKIHEDLYDGYNSADVEIAPRKMMELLAL